MNDLATSTPAETFRGKASDLLVEAAHMTLHQLVDEFLRLTEIMDANVIKGDSGYRSDFNDEGQLAFRERRVVNGAARARFGISFEAFDRNSSPSGDEW